MSTTTLAKTAPATPSWYDLLDVDPTASDADVKAAWKAAIADLEPGDRRFQVLNHAAEVLLDRRRRRAYDAELAAQAPEDEDVSTGPADAAPRRTARVVPGRLLVAVAAVTAAIVGAATVLAVTAPSDASVADATRSAQSAAERAIVPILSYDAAHLDQDQQAAEGFMTADYRRQYDKLFEVIKANAPKTGTVVSAQVVASGIVRSGDDRVSVLLFVDRPTTNKQTGNGSGEPVVYKDQVTVTLQKVGDDWLVDDLVTSPAAG